MITYIAIAVVVVLIIGGAYWYERKHLTTTAVVQADVASEIAKLRATIEKATAPATPPAPPTPAGKNGVAGVLTVAVTGHPEVDLPAINSAYFS